DFETADNISRQLGERTHYERKVNSSGAIVEKEVGVRLMPPGDILALPSGAKKEDVRQAILFTNSTKPIKITPYHWKDFEHATSLPRWQRRKLDVDLNLVRAESLPSHPVESTDLDQELPSRDQHDILRDEMAPEF